MADLAAGTDALAVQVHLRPGIVERRRHPRREALAVLPQQVGHHDDGRDEVSRAERPVEDGAEVVLELRGDAPVDGEVSRVVRPGGDLVDDQVAVLGPEQFGRDDPRRLGQFRDPSSDLERLGRDIKRYGSGSDDLVADAVALDGLDDRVGHHVAGRAARDEDGEFLLDRDEGLDHQRHAPSAGILEQCFRFGAVAEDPDAAAVIAAALRLRDDRPPVIVREAEEVGEVRGVSEGGHRQARLGEAGALVQLVLRVHQRRGPRVDRDPLGEHSLERAEVHEFVVQGDGVHRPSEGEEGDGVVRSAEVHLGADAGSTVVCVLGQEADVDAQGDRRLDHHAGQLTATDDAHRGKPVRGHQRSSDLACTEKW